MDGNSIKIIFITAEQAENAWRIKLKLLSAKSTNGLIFINNKIEKSDFLPSGKPRPAFNFLACTGVLIKGNKFGTEKPVIASKKMLKKDIKE